MCGRVGKTRYYREFGFYRLLGGNGLIYNKLQGNGLAFISVDGEVNEVHLEPGETILVHPGHLAAFDSNVRFEVQRLKGFKNMFLGGDGLPSEAHR